MPIGHADPSLSFVVGDWRRPPPMGPFDLIVGADVLYEERNGPAVAGFLPAHLTPDGEAWIADPGRLHARPFPALAEDAGLVVVGVDTLPPPGEHPREISLLRLRRGR